MTVGKKVVIVGSGPAGYTAGIYAARADLEVVLLAGEKAGGQLINTTLVENWPGSDSGVLGQDLMMQMRKQAEKFGCKVVDKDVNKVDFSQKSFKLWVETEEVLADAVIIATGAESIRLGVKGESELLGRGVATCAVCDAPFYRDKTVVVVGGGDAAIEDAMALTKYAKKVYMAVRKEVFRASKIMVKRAIENSKIEILWNTQVEEVVGEKKVMGVKIVNSVSGEKKELVLDGVFLAIGHKPSSELFKDQIVLDEKGYVKTGMNGLVDGSSVKNVWLSGYPTMTSVEGVFSAGDVVDFRYRQAITAAAMGCQAAIDVEKWLESLNK